MTTNMTTRPDPRPGMPSVPIEQIAEPEHDELARLAFKLVAVLDGAETLPVDIVFDQRQVDIIAYLRAFPGNPLVDDGEKDDVLDAFLAGLGAPTR